MTAESPVIPQFERLVERLPGQPASGYRLLSVRPLTGGISAGMTLLELEGSGQVETLVVRRPAEGDPARRIQAAEGEFKLLHTLHSLGLEVPEPVLVDTSGEALPDPYLVLRFVPGQAVFVPRDLIEFGEQLAAQLARIHRADVARLDFLLGPPDDWREISGRPPAASDPFFEVDRIRDRLDAAWPFHRQNTPVLLHGDYWPGNLLWQGGRLAAVIDWEDARLGDPLIDLAIARLDLLWIMGEAAMQAFTRRYLALTAVEARALPFWDLCAALRLVRLAGDDLEGWAAYFHPYGRHDITPASIRKYYRYYVHQACDAL